MDDLQATWASMSLGDFVTLMAAGCFLLGVLLISASGGLKRGFVLILGAMLSFVSVAALVAAGIMN